MSLLIKNGEIITADSHFHGDILTHKEKIIAIGKNLNGLPHSQIIDASDKYIFPGFIDPHVHIHLPFMGTYAKDTWETAGKGAAVGGTTTLIEMVCPARSEEPIEALKLWKSKADGISPIDYTFHMGVTRFDDSVKEQLTNIVNKQGITSFKIFLAYKGAFGLEDNELFETLTLAKKLGAITTAHCENADLVSSLQNKLLSENKVGPEWHEPSRPVHVEASGCQHLINFAQQTNASVYIVHTSCDEAIQAIQAGKKQGVKAWIETVIPYLTLDSSYAEKPNFEGAKYVMSPPIRSKSQQNKLWNHLANGTISTVGTDHAPFDFATQKHMGHPNADKCLDANFKKTNTQGNFTLIPNGLPSVEDRINLLYTYGVKTGKIDLHRFVSSASTEAAKIFGLFPQKGTIQPGADADIVIYDPHYKGTISAKTQQMDTDYSAFEGTNIEGRPYIVTSRGQIIAQEGEFTGKLGHGKLLQRKPQHF